MRNEKQEIYKNFKIINFNDICIIVDYKGLTQGETNTREQAKEKIDNIIKEQEQKQKVFESLKELNKNTKKAQELYNNYTRARAKELYNCFETCSQAKQNAFGDCLKYFYILNGVNRYIPTYNKNDFHICFLF